MTKTERKRTKEPHLTLPKEFKTIRKFLPKLKTVYLKDFKQFDAFLVKELRKIGGDDSKVNIIFSPSSSEEIEEKIRFLSHLDCIGGIIASQIPIDLSEEDSIKLDRNTIILPGQMRESEALYRMSKPTSLDSRSSPLELDIPKHINLQDLESFTKKHQEEGKKVVFVTGVFDVLHPGHIDYLLNAKAQGDILILLINSDYSATNQSKNSSGDRPINPLVDRATVLSSLDVIDHITPFDDLNVTKILGTLHNITYAKTEKDLESLTVGKEIEIVEQNGGDIAIIPPISSSGRTEVLLSSSELIKKEREGTYRKEDDNDPRIGEVDATEGYLEYLEKHFGVTIEPVTPTYDAIVKNTVLKVLAENANSGIISNLRKKLIEVKQSETLDNLVNIENEILGQVVEYCSKISFENEMVKLLFMTLVLRSIGWDCRLISYQSRKDKTDFRDAIEMKTSDGKMAFIDPKSSTLHKSIDFHSDYFKLLPGHKNYELRSGHENFAKRIYYYPKELRDAALVVKLIRSAGNSKESDQEIRDVMEVVWENHGLLHENGQIESEVASVELETNRPGDLPEIVAHGGVAVFELNGGAENSEQGIIEAIKLGVDLLELDIVPTKDGKWLITHHVDLGLTTNISGNTTDYDYEYLIEHAKLVDANGQILSSNLIGLEDALRIIKRYKDVDATSLIAKIDLKHLGPGDLRELVKTIEKSGIPKSKFIFTAGELEVAHALHQTDPSLHFEINTVEIINYLLSNNLMDEDIVLTLFIEYLDSYAHQMNAVTVSLMQVAMNIWGKKIFHKLVRNIHDLNMRTQIWVANNVEEYLYDAESGADHVLMHNSQLITSCLKLRE